MAHYPDRTHSGSIGKLAIRTVAYGLAAAIGTFGGIAMLCILSPGALSKLVALLQ